jgi:antirestriction protein ArdC
MRGDVRDEIAKAFLDSLNSGRVPWQRPWNSTGARPRNAISRKPYRGINSLYLGLVATLKGYPTGEWITKNQCVAAGGRIIYEEFRKFVNVVLWKPMVSEKTDEAGKKVKKVWRMCKSYEVWNVAQCTGLPARKVVEVAPVEPIAAAQAIVDAMPNKPKIHIVESDRAFYRPSDDMVVVPELKQFSKAEGFYATVFHELAHATGHASRLNREGITNAIMFGNHSYSKEELVAEITSSFVSAEAGILESVQDNSVSYVQTWASRLQNDPRMIIEAVGQAQKAADTILGVSFDAAA